MNIEEINNILSDYQKLINRVEEIVTLLNKLKIAEKFKSLPFIEKIYFDNELINVHSQDYYGGQTDDRSIELPIIFLTMSDNEISDYVYLESKKIEEEKAEQKRKLLEKTQQDKDKKDFEEYQRLRSKFEHMPVDEKL